VKIKLKPDKKQDSFSNSVYTLRHQWGNQINPKPKFNLGLKFSSGLIFVSLSSKWWNFSIFLILRWS